MKTRQEQWNPLAEKAAKAEKQNDKLKYLWIGFPLSESFRLTNSQVKNIFVIFEPCKFKEIDAQNTLQRHKRETLLIKNLKWWQSRSLCNMSMQILNAPGDGSMQPQTKVY